MSGSRLFYFNSTIEVELGDRVLWSRFLRAPLRGVVCYIPGPSPKHSELEYEDVLQWAVRTEDGSVYPILYDPDNFQPPKRIRFVGRGEAGTLDPREGLE
jgi:hypothetical protein